MLNIGHILLYRCYIALLSSVIVCFTSVFTFCLGCTFTSLCLPQEEIGFNMKILDIGGGFSGSETQLELVSF